MQRLLLLSLLLVVSASVFAQWRDARNPAPEHFLSSYLSPPDDSVSHQRPRKSPTLAIVLSAVVPGAGQFYTERYLKIPIIWGFGGYFVSQWLKADKRYRDFRSQYAESVRLGVGGGRGDTRLRYVRDFYHDERDRFGFYIALTYLLNIVDAYVGASLYNFEVSDDLGGDVSMTVRITLR